MSVPGAVPAPSMTDTTTLSRAASMHSHVPITSSMPMQPPLAGGPPPLIPSVSSAPPQATTQKLYFSHVTDLAPFLNHSRHRILYANKIYPTATHLHEALKYLPHRPDLAERLRNTDAVEDVYRLSEQWEHQYGTEGAGVRNDWRNVFLSMVSAHYSCGHDVDISSPADGGSPISQI